MATVDEKTTTDGLIDHIIEINRTTAVVAGGRKFSFTATVVVGDQDGRFGYGKGKSSEVPEAIRKANEQARKNMVRIPRNGVTLIHPILSKHGASAVFMKPASEGTGSISGGAMRDVFNVAGIKDVVAKCIGSSNRKNVLLATIKGLLSMATPESIAAKRGKTLEEIETCMD